MKSFRFICKSFILLIATKIAVKYWMIIDTPLLYWAIWGILLYFWNDTNYGKKRNKIVLFFGAVLLTFSVLTTYFVRNQFAFKGKSAIILLEFIFLFVFSWLVLNSFFLLFDWISNRSYVMEIDITKIGIGIKKEFIYVFFFLFFMWLPYFLTWYPG